MHGVAQQYWSNGVSGNDAATGLPLPSKHVAPGLHRSATSNATRAAAGDDESDRVPYSMRET